ncbi:MAG: translation elongation factor Ts [Holosporales bacterium]|nr:translation elongation factor Ts [Holosporales bacterium]
MVITAEMIRAIREKTGAGMTDCKKALVENDGDFDAAIDWLRKKGLAAAASKSSRVAADGLVGVSSFGNNCAAILEVNSETDFVAKNSKFQEFVSNAVKLGSELGAKDADATLDQLLAMNIGSQSVQSTLTDLIAVIGENLVVRRIKTISVQNGVVATYAHSTVAPGLGKIGVLVALESPGDQAILVEFGKKIAMHIAAASPKYLNVSDVPADVIEHERSILLEQVQGSDRPAAVLEKMIEGRLRKFYEDVVLNEQAYIIDNKKNISSAVSDLSKELNAPVSISGFVRFALGDGIQKAEANFADEVMSIANK